MARKRSVYYQEIPEAANDEQGWSVENKQTYSFQISGEYPIDIQNMSFVAYTYLEYWLKNLCLI